LKAWKRMWEQKEMYPEAQVSYDDVIADLL